MAERPQLFSPPTLYRFREPAHSDTVSPMRSWPVPRPAIRAGLFDGPASPAVAAVFDSRALFVAQVAVLLAMLAIVATKVWQEHLGVGFALAGLSAVLWSPELWRVRIRSWWFIYVAGIFFYTLLRALADETAIPIHSAYVIDFDHLVFFGREPVEVLQDRLFSTSRVTALDVGAVLTHWSFFLAPHVAAIAIFFWRRDLFARYVALVVGTMYMGLLLFFFIPTTPPWLAAQANQLSGVFRIMDFVGGTVNRDTYASFHASLGEPNSVAAMPSIHMGVTFAMYLWARAHYRRAAWPLLAYCAVMGFALVYLGEHYVLDLLVGIVVASAAFWASRRLVPGVESTSAP